jgi:hypothetical protein
MLVVHNHSPHICSTWTPTPCFARQFLHSGTTVAVCWGMSGPQEEWIVELWWNEWTPSGGFEQFLSSLQQMC